MVIHICISNRRVYIIYKNLFWTTSFPTLLLSVFIILAIQECLWNISISTPLITIIMKLSIFSRLLSIPTYFFWSTFEVSYFSTALFFSYWFLLCGYMSSTVSFPILWLAFSLFNGVLWLEVFSLTGVQVINLLLVVSVLCVLFKISLTPPQGHQDILLCYLLEALLLSLSHLCLKCTRNWCLYNFFFSHMTIQIF